MVQKDIYTLGIDIGSTTVKIAVLDNDKTAAPSQAADKGDSHDQLNRSPI